MGANKEKKQRIREIINKLEFCKQNKIDVSFKKLVAESCILWGTSERTLVEYLNQLETVGRIKLDIKKDKIEIIPQEPEQVLKEAGLGK